MGYERPLRKGPVDWEVLKEAFLCSFSPIELRERVGRIHKPSSRGYECEEVFSQTTELSKYATTIVVNSRDKMNKLMMGVSTLVEKENINAP